MAVVFLVIAITFVVIVLIRQVRHDLRLQKDAESDNIEVRREALYELGNDAWNLAHTNNPKMTSVERDKYKNWAVEYWVQAERLGHEGAADKLLMAQIRR